MSLTDDNGPDIGGDDIIAAEYVVGVLPADQRKTVAHRIEHDAVFARLVEAWEARLAPLGEAYSPVQPPQSVKQMLDLQLFGSGSANTPANAKPGLFSSLVFWRGLAVAALAALAITVGADMFRAPATPDMPTFKLVASLAADGSDVRYMALYDPVSHHVALTHLAGDREAGRDFELWVIEGNSAPVSMGVIAAGANRTLDVNEATRTKLADGATLAISLEPSGGSPTGQPTGPVVAAGGLIKI